MTEPSGMYCTCRTGRSLNMVIFTVTPFVKKESRGGTRRHRPCRDEWCYGRQLKCPAALAAIVEDDKKRQATCGHEIWHPKPKISTAPPSS